jgi:uncharacterized protein
MFSIQKWFAKDDEFLELLQASAQASRASVQALKEILQNQKTGPEPGGLRRHAPRGQGHHRKNHRTAGQNLDHLAGPRRHRGHFQRALQDSQDGGKFAERYSVCGAQLSAVNFSAQVALAEQSTDIVVVMIMALEKSHFAEVNSYNEKLQTIEGDADKLMLQLLAELYSGRHPPLTVIIVKDLYELLEKVVDRCRDVGNVVANVVLKHS